tara:strand:- start:308 stop:1630 length:1323 start_codon:yes stop_codon:yes gene_type:complete
MQLNKKNIDNIFYTFITIHLIFWTLIPTLTNHNLPLDVIEALAWGSNLDWGFNKHPPMSAFFLEIMYQIFGPQDWAFYFLSQLFLIIAFLTVYQLSKKILKNDLLSLFAVLLLEGVYFYNYTSPEFNVNVCQLPFWALTVYYSWKILNEKKKSFYDYVLLGTFAAIGFLSKYLFIYLLGGICFLFLYLVFFKKETKFDFKYLISIEIFAILLIPHFIWLNENNYITIIYGLNRTGIDEPNLLDNFYFPIIFLLKQIGILSPLFVMMFFLIKKIKLKLNKKDKNFIFLFFVTIIPIFLMFLTSFFMGSKIRTMWMTPFYLFLGLFLIYIFQYQIKVNKIKNFIIIFLFFFILSPFTYAYVSISNKDKRTDYPGKEVAKKIQYAWDEDNRDKIEVVLGDEWTAGNLSYHLKSRPVWEGFITNEKLNSLSKFLCIDNVCVGKK